MSFPFLSEAVVSGKGNGYIWEDTLSSRRNGGRGGGGAGGERGGEGRWEGEEGGGGRRGVICC